MHARARGRSRPRARALCSERTLEENFDMGRGLILWLVGIPLPIVLLLYFLGYLGG
jgi:hypothetical protein